MPDLFENKRNYVLGDPELEILPQHVPTAEQASINLENKQIWTQLPEASFPTRPNPAINTTVPSKPIRGLAPAL